MNGNEWHFWLVIYFLTLFLQSVTWDLVVHSPTGVALESAPSQYLGLAGRVVCSGTVLAQPFK